MQSREIVQIYSISGGTASALQKENLGVNTLFSRMVSNKSFEMLIRRRFRIWISKEFLPVNEVRRAYYHKWEERIGWPCKNGNPHSSRSSLRRWRFCSVGSMANGKRKQRFAVRSRALSQLPRSFARSSDKTAGHPGYSWGHKTVSSVSAFVPCVFRLK